ncbi:MAG: hypothetical protein LLG20_25560 [Acidobacteriales bacterium]|nr:hypothetical protein [Terriglobales bacterium]
MRILMVFAVLVLPDLAGGAFIARDGKAEAVIVSAEPNQYAATELRRYVENITGARLEIVAPGALRNGMLNIVVGGPLARKLAPMEGLKRDGFVLWRTKAGAHEVLVAAGNDDAATLYAVYDIIERFGATFLITKDILPETVRDLRAPDVQLKIESPFPRRGLLISNIYPNRGIWHLNEVKAFLDQMAKMKMNYLQFFWFEHEPWIDFTYRGEHKLLGDATTKETGYMTWRYHYGSQLTKDIEVGREHFRGRERMAPAEFQHVETPEQAFRVAADFLREIIRYARTRHIKVWLCIDPTTLQGNHARFARRATNLQLPFHPILGTHMCPADPVLHEINAERVKALAETYPEAEGYILYRPEMYPDCPDLEDQALFARERGRFDGVLRLWDPYKGYERKPDIVRDSNIGSVHIALKALEARDRVAPRAHIAIGGIGRGYLLPFIDKSFPKDVPFTDMESRAIWTPAGVPMEYFGGMGARERTLVPRMDDDSAMFGMQFNVNLYYKDRMLEGSLENGVAGFAGQLNRARGTEQNTLYLAAGAWRPHLTPKEFYSEYAARLFGERAQKSVETAFATLEENEEYLGWTGAGNFGCCGVIQEVSHAYGFYRQANHFDGPRNWDGFRKSSAKRIEQFEHAAGLLDRAARELRSTEPLAAPRGKAELAYLINKTESYAMLLRTLVAARRAYLAFDDAFRDRKQVGEAEFVRRLDASMEMVRQARRMGRRTTEKFAEIIDHPSDLGTLYRANLFLVTGLELAEKTFENVWNFHHGRDYTRPVEWTRIYHPYPTFAPPW